MRRWIGLAMFAASAALAQPYPTQPVRIIVSAVPGGPTDALARMLADRLQQKLGGTFLVENRGGANGTIGVNAVARAVPDGHTILMTVDGPILVAPALAKDIPYDPHKDLQPLAIIGDEGNMVLAVHADSPAKSAAELVAQMRADPSKANYVSGGAGFPSHIVAELFKREARFDAQHIPVRGAGAAITDLLSGRMSFSFPPVSLATAHAKAGKIRLLAIASSRRASQIPDVPTFAEQGIANLAPPGYWIGSFLPAGTPRELVNRLAAEVRAVTASPEYAPLLARQGLAPQAQTPDEIAPRIKREAEYWAKTVRELGIRSD